MYSLLIVDDEPMVIRGLCRQIDWESYGLELAGTADTAEKALSLLKQKKIDILFTDICMPGMNGLKLISLARKLNPFGRNIIVSAHSEFDYVKEALLLGVENYLLKPVNQIELDKTLEKTIDNLKKSLADNSETRTGISSFKDNILDRWLNGAIQDYELYERASLANIDLSFGACQVVLIAILKQDSTFKINLFLDICKEIFRDAFEAEVFVDRFGRVAAMLFDDNLENRQEALINCIERILAVAASPRNRIFICAGRVENNIENISLNYSNANVYLNYHYIDPEADFVFCESYISKTAASGCKPMLAELEEAVLNEDMTAAKDLIKKIEEHCSKISEDEARTCFVAYLILLIRLILESGHAQDGLSEIDTGMFSVFSSQHNGSVSVAGLIELTEKAMSVIRKRNKTLHPLVYRTLSRMKNNYQTDLSLKTFAAEFDVSPVYLGQLFKEGTGKYFNEFLTEVRLKASKDLLIKTDLKIKEIVYRIGIPNQSYFNRIFKNAYAMSPLSYRYQSKQENKYN